MKWIEKLFGLYPESIILFTEADGELEVPDDSGNSHLDESKLYIVQGDLKPSFGVGEAGPSSSLSASRTPMLPTGTSASPYPLINQKKSKRFSIQTKTRESSSTDTGGGWRENVELHSYNRATGELQKTSNYPLSLHDYFISQFGSSNGKYQLSAIPIMELSYLTRIISRYNTTPAHKVIVLLWQ